MNTATRSRTDHASSAGRAFLPSDLPSDRTLVRAVTAEAVAAIRRTGNPAGVARTFWPRDPAVPALIERAASSPATTTTAGWAAELAGRAVGEFIGSLLPTAGAALIAAAPRFSMDGVVQIALPRATSNGTAMWVAEGAPGPVGQGVISGAMLGPPHKLMLIETATSEIDALAAEDAETILGILVRDAASRSLDLSLFSSTAADSTRPAGIFAGISPIAAAPGGGLNAAMADVGALAAAIVAAGGGGAILYFASPGRAVTLKGYAPGLASQVFASAAIPPTSLMAVDSASFASGFDSTPTITASREATFHQEDTTPLHISTGAQGSAVVATPVRSIFQSDCLALRMTLRAAWVLRIPGAAAWITSGLTW